MSIFKVLKFKVIYVEEKWFWIFQCIQEFYCIKVKNWCYRVNIKLLGKYLNRYNVFILKRYIYILEKFFQNVLKSKKLGLSQV